MKKTILAMVIIALFSGWIWSEALAKGRNETKEMNGVYRETLSTWSAEGSLLFYTSGYVCGYDYALSQVLAVLQKQPYSQKNLAAFIAMLKFPEKFINTEIKQQIDLFYK